MISHETNLIATTTIEDVRVTSLLLDAATILSFTIDNDAMNTYKNSGGDIVIVKTAFTTARLLKLIATKNQ